MRVNVSTPNPGSDEAVKIGCCCAVLDNAHGAGFMGNPDTFWINEDCPIHGPEYREAAKQQLSDQAQDLKMGDEK